MCKGYLLDGELPNIVRSRLGVAPCPPWRVMAITFTNKAAGELKARLCQMLGEGGDEVWASTFHSSCARILRRDGDRLGYTSHFTIYDTDDSRRLMKDVLKDLDIPERALSVRGALAEISRAKDKLTTPEDFEAGAGDDFRLKKVAQAYRVYQRRLADADAMDFDDLIVNAVRLFETCPDVLEYYQNRFRYLMVDEYQDTNHAQYRFVSLLAQRSGNLCVVGDDDQSIYKFPGGPPSRTFYTSRRTSPGPRWCAWSRTTAPPRTSWTPPTPSSPTIRSAKARPFGPPPGQGRKSACTWRKTSRTRPTASPRPFWTGCPRAGSSRTSPCSTG